MSGFRFVLGLRPNHPERRAFGALFFVVGAFLATRAVIFVLVAAAEACLPRITPTADVALPHHPFWNRFFNWDSFHYIHIVDHGYVLAEHTPAFFPLYPYLARWLGYVVGSPWFAGLLVSHVATLVGMWFLYGIARRYVGDGGARRAVLFALVFPGSVFFSCFYTEGLYFAAIAGALYFYDEGRLAPASAWGFVAVLTRPTGMLLFIALAIGWLHRRRWRLRDLEPRDAWLLLLPAALALVMLFYSHEVGDPLAFVHVQGNWARKSTFPLLTIAQAAQDVVATGLRPSLEDGPQALMRMFDIGTALFLFAAAAAAVRRLDAAHTIFIVLSALMPLSSGLVAGLERYASVVVPVFVVMASVSKKETTAKLMFVVSALLLGLRTVFLAVGLWAG